MPIQSSPESPREDLADIYDAYRRYMASVPDRDTVIQSLEAFASWWDSLDELCREYQRHLYTTPIAERSTMRAVEIKRLLADTAWREQTRLEIESLFGDDWPEEVDVGDSRVSQPGDAPQG